MKIKSFYIIVFFSFFYTQHIISQDNEELKVATEKVAVKKKKEKKLRPYEPLAPARAAFYSAVLPGLGQAYTGKYWKIPIVYGAIGTGLYFYIDNNNKYNRFRDIYKARLAGTDPNDLEFPNLTDDQLIDLQRRFRRDQELSLLITVGLYVLNIVDANVTAHLQQYNVTDDLSLRPKIDFDEFNIKPNYGLSLSYSF
ncbi:DUF5683 domain-containing protein [Aquimarina sp. 2201CG5-10]|uniref:DUF5683 domain-containing protein n=1 Tax=Aquimarina callyspongiae TaxID=3098150 RepID=UPI002AB56E4C|nr:DUF5683 domain-containing protein [Aquimarina sp. 2201CG5-10]MDY8137642.1 DUF5683 domain-containing protein [Aquimarina sp. 2201CG5-10]